MEDTYGTSAVKCICLAVMSLEECQLDYHMDGPSLEIDAAVEITSELLECLNDRSLS